MFATCDSSGIAAASTDFNNQTTTITPTSSPQMAKNSSSTNLYSTASDSEHAIGVFLLICFRIMNSSFLSTAVLVFVKSVRGMYQKYRGLYSLTLQQRIPLMGLFADRVIHVMLGIYAFLIIPCALA